MSQKYGLMQVTFSNGNSRKVPIPHEKYLQLRESLFEAASTGASIWFWLTDENGQETMFQSQYVAMIEYEPMDG